jgi:ABC-type nitrate/sulfonate/bicarbonate transport system ATPase subunit
LAIQGPVKLQVKDLGKIFTIDEGWGRSTDITALEGVNFDVRAGEFVSLIGPSGCGKSTLLMIVAGLYDKTSGDVVLDDHHIDGTGFDRGVVFQEFAVFPWLTVSGNVRFGMRMKGIPKAERDPVVERLLGLVELQGFKNIYPYRLSGGMKQRVGIARALAFDPEVMLMDEPFGALDAQTRSSLQQLLVQVWMETHKTVLFVTHSVREAAYLSDRVLMMSPRPGRIAEEIKIDLPRPRDALSVEFLECERKVAETLARLTGQSDGGPAWVTD